MFILDDFSNLNALKDFSEDNFWLKFGQFVTEGGAGELGRPISLLSFALQYHAWSDIQAFKYVNLMIHVLNGSLVFWIFVLIAPLTALSPHQRHILIFLATAIWLFHPIQISTTLYVVQRMAQLSTLFILLGIVLYLKGRFLLAADKLKIGFFTVSGAVVICGILAVFSKENGVLLVFYLLVLEFTLLQSLKTPVYWQSWKFVFLYLPCALLIAYLLYSVGFSQKTHENYITLGFTVTERLLTQSRVLFDYLLQILLVNPEQFGLAHDDYVLSHSLLEPSITLFTTGVVLAFLIAGFWFRKTVIVFSFSVLWFFAGHLLESSVIPLMLYFEHRNYLPLVGVSFGLVYGCLWLYNYLKQSKMQGIIIFSGALWLSFAVYLCWVQATIWVNPLYQSNLWAEKHPDSRIAQSLKAFVYISLGFEAESEQVYREMLVRFPNATGPMLLLYGRRCFFQENLTDVEINALYDKVKTARADSASIAALNTIVNERMAGRCQAISVEAVEKTLQYLLENPQTGSYKRNLYVLQSLFYSHQSKFEQALQGIEQAIALKDDTPDYRFWRLAWLLSLNRQADTVQAFADIEKQFSFLQRLIYKDELDFWQREIAKIALSNPKNEQGQPTQ
ncbi:hypothetical protein [Beggiatoa alba]|nr:hypothetical protein [Beggiatoa alba]